jgi:hypothetical protein
MYEIILQFTFHIFKILKGIGELNSGKKSYSNKQTDNFPSKETIIYLFHSLLNNEYSMLYSRASALASKFRNGNESLQISHSELFDFSNVKR